MVVKHRFHCTAKTSKQKESPKELDKWDTSINQITGGDENCTRLNVQDEGLELEVHNFDNDELFPEEISKRRT